MWAFALWDRQTGELFCSRDRFGIKPFYYRCEGQRLVFASELKAFRAGSAPLDAEPARSPRLPRARIARPHGRDLLRRDHATPPSPLDDVQPARAEAQAILESGVRRTLAGTPETRFERSSSTRSVCSCAATSRSARVSPGESTPRRSSARSITCCERNPSRRNLSERSNGRSPRTSLIPGSTSGRTPEPLSTGLVPMRTGSPSPATISRRTWRPSLKPTTSRFVRRA